jgi:hypothetical protein
VKGAASLERMALEQVQDTLEAAALPRVTAIEI